MMAVFDNISALLGNNIPNYCDVISVLKLELTCKKYMKRDAFWIDRLKQKYRLEPPEGENAKDYTVMIELIYTFSEHNFIQIKKRLIIHLHIGMQKVSLKHQ